MKQTWNSVVSEVKHLTQKVQENGLVMSWLSLLMLAAVLSWATLRRLLNLLGRMLTAKIHYLGRILTKINTSQN